nr:MAG TPA: hypothetical protein [Caudoviricetes sp.]
MVFYKRIILIDHFLNNKYIGKLKFPRLFHSSLNIILN